MIQKIIWNWIEERVLVQIQGFMPISMVPINFGIKYLGYFINLDKYLKEDELCIVKKIEKKVSKLKI